MKTTQASWTRWLLLAAVILPRMASASLGGQFHLTSAAWSASDIVIADTTAEEGNFQVVERLKGDLAVGSHIVIRGLIPVADAVPISRYPLPSSKNDDNAQKIPRQPVGSAVVLFLYRKQEATGAVTATTVRWAGWDGDVGAESIKHSVLWIDGEQLYSFQKDRSSLPPAVLSVLIDSQATGACCVAMTMVRLKHVVQEELAVQQSEDAAIAVPNGGERALRLKTFVKSPVVFARRVALRELGRSGQGAVATISEMLDDPNYSEESSDLVRALASAGGKTVAEQLQLRLERDVAFWSSAAASLKENWWNDDPSPESPLRNRYGQTLMLVQELKEIDYKPALTAALSLRSVWLALPPLGPDDHQMIDECNELISKLQANSAEID